MTVSKDDLHRLIDEIDDPVEIEFVYQFIDAVIHRDNDSGHWSEKSELEWEEENIKKDPLWKFSLKPELLHEENGSITFALDVLGIYANGDTVQEAKTDLIEQLKVYTEEYLTNIQLYHNASNRKHHLPFVLRVALCDSDEDLEKLLDV
ncbi:hypothetical protein LLE49_09065 [Alicyclobacillus tolerans]|uniref:hypothetical protein n=1 Tax=Alicyclobacillus tolerans TaxID=90970 RepID=UPI001F4801A5|nr:hypothetical protein [Alicyclobacillus tolerans]MCF8564867.1 hypothetical protein [Alicyclobacillus tolerans]